MGGIKESGSLTSSSTCIGSFNGSSFVFEGSSGS
jgi:hypothetical protein